jgi:predicted ATPase with chaperone activity
VRPTYISDQYRNSLTNTRRTALLLARTLLIIKVGTNMETKKFNTRNTTQNVHHSHVLSIIVRKRAMLPSKEINFNLRPSVIRARDSASRLRIALTIDVLIDTLLHCIVLGVLLLYRRSTAVQSTLNTSLLCANASASKRILNNMRQISHVTCTNHLTKKSSCIRTRNFNGIAVHKSSNNVTILRAIRNIVRIK